MFFISTLGVVFGVFAGLLQFLGYKSYFKKVTLRKIKPNSASWGIWAFGAVLESFSYIFLTNDWVKDFLPFICAVSAISFFILVYLRGHFGRPGRIEWFIVLFDVTIIIIWWLTKSAFIANFLFILTAIISFVPIYIHTYNDPEKEDSHPWLLWSFAYSSMIMAVLLRWEKWQDLLYPLIFLILHLIMYFLAFDMKERRFWKL